MRSSQRLALVPLALLGSVATAGSCIDEGGDCSRNPIACPPSSQTASSSSSGSGSDAPCGGPCPTDRPYCDEDGDVCRACLQDADCVEPSLARCDAGECVPCNDNAQCEGIGDTAVCSASEGRCVTCDVNQEEACEDGQTCDLVTKTCSDVPPRTLGACDACTNTMQCASNLGCLKTRHKGSDNGFFCLGLYFPAVCDPPYKIRISDRETVEGTISFGACAFDESRTTCAAIKAAEAQLSCTNDGFCTPAGGGASVETLGAVCRSAQGVLGSVCTYECAESAHCLSTGPLSTCGFDGHCGTPPL